MSARVIEESLDAAALVHLARAVELAKISRAGGNHPFGALLTDADGNVLLEAQNSVCTTGDLTGHAETNLIREATMTLAPEVLAGATLFSSTEPCAMCSGAFYWANIGRLVFALSESGLRKLTGDDERNLTLSLDCRRVFAAGGRPIRVAGPVDLPGAVDVHEGFWQ